MKKIIWLLCFWLISNPGNVHAQGKAYNWLLGYDIGLFDTNVTSTKSFLRFDSVSVNQNLRIPEQMGQHIRLARLHRKIRTEQMAE